MTVLVVDKPVGPTSFGVVKQVRGALARRWGRPARAFKIGHGGTLDPAASGVLPVCVGEATKLAPFLLDADKEYEATVRFGVETDTLDADGAVVATGDVTGLTEAAVAAALAPFRGTIDQVPPLYSALKHRGRRLYSYARAGEMVERAARRITVYELELLAFEPPDVARLRVRCSKGTYVRVLAADLGRTLGAGAHLAALRRLASGPFQITSAIPLAALVAAIAAGAPLPFVSCAQALSHLPSVIAGPEVARALRRGQPVDWSALAGPAPGPTGGTWRALEEDGALVAVIEHGADGRVRTQRVWRAVSATEPWAS